MNGKHRSTPLKFIEDFLRLEAAGGIVLVAAALLALVWANSP
jgi:Na+/H+ antiporter NhaA